MNEEIDGEFVCRPVDEHWVEAPNGSRISGVPTDDSVRGDGATRCYTFEYSDEAKARMQDDIDSGALAEKWQASLQRAAAEFNTDQTQKWVQQHVDSLAKIGRFIWPRPIPVTERLPERINGEVLCWCRVHDAWETSYRARCDALPSSPSGFDPERDGWAGDAACRFTHWLPLPPIPQDSAQSPD